MPYCERCYIETMGQEKKCEGCQWETHNHFKGKVLWEYPLNERFAESYRRSRIIPEKSIIVVQAISWRKRKKKILSQIRNLMANYDMILSRCVPKRVIDAMSELGVPYGVFLTIED
jgi:hypothetical protein